MGKELRFGGSFGKGQGAGIRKVIDEPARLALTPATGDFVVQLDTNELWYWDGSAWQKYGGVNSVIYYADTNSIDLVLTSNTLTANFKISATGPDAANQKVTLITEADGIRAQILDSAIRGLFTATSPVTYDNTTGTIAMPAADGSTNGYMTAGAYTALQTAYGLRHVAMTVGAFGSTPNADGLSVDGTDNQTLHLQPADGSNPGAITAGAQIIGGTKTFNNTVNADKMFASTYSRPVGVTTLATIGSISGMSGGDMVVVTDYNRLYIYNGLMWEPVAGYHKISDVTYTSGNLMLDRYSAQIVPIKSSGGAISVTGIFHSTMAPQSEVMFFGLNDSNPVVLDSITGLILNGSVVLGLNDWVRCMKIGTSLIEVSRSA